MPGLRTAPKRKAPMKRTAPKKTSVVKKVTALAKQVKKLNTISYDKVMFKGYSQDTSVTQPFYQYHINNLTSSWTPIFGYDNADVSNANKIYVNEYKVDARLRQNSEGDLIYYTAFVVSLKDQGADSVTFDPATGTLTLQDGVHYTSLGAQGKVMVSKTFFNIHAYKRFYMGGRVGDQSAPVLKDLTFTIKPRQRLITNPKGNILGLGGLSFPKDPSQNYYMLLFNDDSGVDFQVNSINVSTLVSAAIPN